MRRSYRGAADGRKIFPIPEVADGAALNLLAKSVPE
jgi:hypothetical protein